MSFEQLSHSLCSLADSYKLLSREEEIKIARMAISGDKNAKETLIYSNIRFVIKIARNYKAKYNIALEDLIQAALLGMTKALEKFNPEKNIRFITFAVFYIKDEILKECNYMARTIKLSEGGINKFRRIKEISKIYSIDINTAEGQKKLAEKMTIPFWQIKNILQANTPVESIDANIENDKNGNLSLKNTLYVESNAENFIFIEDLKNGIKNAIKDKNDRLIVKMKLGLDCNKISEREIAKYLTKINNKKISHTTVNNRYNRCIEILKHSRFMQGYEDFFYAA
ncbi:MAG: sigma-70 family RNA polymerase sigma factor [Treponema sp.]|nr:sigma-70 family RNA polymerase sigma factor [Treponema sp.]